MKTKIITSLFLVFLVLTSCNKNKKETIDFKFNNEAQLISCKSNDSLLINEAIYSFEKDINTVLNKNAQNANKIYAVFINQLTQRLFKPEEFASAHSLKIAKALNETPIFKNNTFNYDSELADCLFASVKNKGLNTSLNALKTSNSLRDNIVLLTFKNEIRHFYNDKNLATILALRYYYPELLKLNETDLIQPLDNTTTNPNVDFNKTPNQPIKPKVKQEQPGHEGHNH